MDKRHPSSFQQLEKLGEGTYATVSFPHLTSPNRRCCAVISECHPRAVDMR